MKRRPPTTPEVAALEARVVRLADLMERAMAKFSREPSFKTPRSVALSWRAATIRLALFTAVNKLREARRNP